MRTSNRQQATFNRQKSDVPPNNCGLQSARTGGMQRSSLSVTLGFDGYRTRPEGDVFQIRVTWERPGDSAECEATQGLRTIGVTETFAVEPGKDVTINGDGGLSIRIHRR